MYHALLLDVRFLTMLLGIDREVAAAVKATGCPCGGRLHGGDFRRKPRGGPAGLGVEHEMRFSFCCGEEGCRKRTTPASVRFLGRRVYLGMVVLLGALFEGGVTAGRVRDLQELTGSPIDRRTLTRWVEWWRETLPKSRGWRAMTGLFRGRVEVGRLPLSLLELVGGEDAATRVSRLLGLLSGRRIDHAV